MRVGLRWPLPLSLFPTVGSEAIRNIERFGEAYMLTKYIVQSTEIKVGRHEAYLR